jgi:hypothetical protein
MMIAVITGNSTFTGKFDKLATAPSPEIGVDAEIGWKI